MSEQTGIKFLVGAVAFLLLLGITFALAPFTMVQQGNMGIVLTWGKYSRTLSPGFHWLAPFADSVETMDVTEQIMPVTELAYSKDAQTVSAEVTVNFQLDQAKVDQVYSNVRQQYAERLVVPPVKNAIKEVFSKYTAQGVLDNRSLIPGQIKDLILSSVGAESGIFIKNVNVTNIDFDDQYEDAVRNKQVQEQKALAAINVTKQTEEEKKQEINRAEALAEKTRLEAVALNSAQGEKLIAKIYAEAALEMAKKWNGSVPSTYIGGSEAGGSGFFSFLNLNGLMKE